ncbi:DUF397 domain-containing protein [Streptomyces acidicola]|uniref:DUF397 domain-containing protein n=1 Tax=Streptomyces acidicola TaxID=2596892 RepID=UPI0037A5836F
MTGLRWQKSTYSEGGADTCVEVAREQTGTVRLRESVTPSTVATVAPYALVALIDWAKREAPSGD